MKNLVREPDAVCAHKTAGFSLLRLRLAASSEKVPSNMRRFRSSCACAKYQPGLWSPLINSSISNDSLSGQWRPRSACAYAQADLGLRCPHVPEDTFTHGAAHMKKARAMLACCASSQFDHSFSVHYTTLSICEDIYIMCTLMFLYVI